MKYSHLLIIFILIFSNFIMIFNPIQNVVGTPSGGNISGDTVYWENEYGNLSMYPHTDYNIITHEQLCNVTSYITNTVDVAFRFNETITGHIWIWDGDSWQDVVMQHTSYGGKEYYYYQGFNVIEDTSYRFKWIYNTSANSSGKFDVIFKLNSESISEALASGHYCMLDPWWNANWGSRIGIVISDIFNGDNVVNFPLLVNFTGHTNIISKCQAGGWDLRFVNQANTTEYYYHFADSWASYPRVWVQIPSINADSETYFNVYFNNPDAGQSSYYSADTVWTSKYVAVYYMNSTLDMSGNGYDLSNNGVTFTTTSGSIGNAGYFDSGGNDHMYITTDALINEMLGSTGSGIMMGLQYTGSELGNRVPISCNNTGNTESFLDYYRSNSPGTDIEVASEHAGGNPWGETLSSCNLGGIDMYARMSSATPNHWLTFWINKDSTTWDVNKTYVGTHPTSSTGRLIIGADTNDAQNFIGYIDTVILIQTNLSEQEMILWTYNYKGYGLLSFSDISELNVETEAITDKRPTSAILHGTVNESYGDEYNCGFIYGTISPVTSANADGNITCPDIYGAGSNFEYNITSLTQGELYYVKGWINDTLDRWAYGNEIDFFTYPDNATNIILSNLDNGIRIDWTHGTGYDASVLLVNNSGISGYPTHPDDTDFTEIYNGSSNTYDYTDLQQTATYYFAVYEYASEGVYSEHSQSYIGNNMIFQDYVAYCNDTTDITEHNSTLNGAFAGSSLNDDYDYGFWLGTSTPIQEGTYSSNISVGTGPEGTEFTYDLSNLDDGVTYYAKSWITNASKFFLSSAEESFSTIPEDPKSFDISYTSTNGSLHLTWTRPYGDSATTVIVAEKNNYPDDWSDTDADIVNNDTGTSYWFTGRMGTHWYFRVYGHINPFSTNYSEGYYFIPPMPPTSVTATVENNNTFTIDWTKGLNATWTIIVRKYGSFPTSVTDGTIVENTTNEQWNCNFIESNYYYTLFSLANETYSEGATVDVGGFVINCFDEEANSALRFNVLVSNQAGTESYTASNVSNPHVIDVNDLPQGEHIQVKISPADYINNREETYSGFPPEQNRTVTYIVLTESPKSKDTVSVETWNRTSGGNSYPTFQLDDDLITIYPEEADSFSDINITYEVEEYGFRTYYYDFNTSSFYLLNAYLPPPNLKQLYVLEVVDTVGTKLENAFISIKRNIGGNYVNISTLYTGSNGQADVYLIPEETYIVNITLSGYTQTGNKFWIPNDLVYLKTFVLSYGSEPVQPDNYIWEYVTFTGTRNDKNLTLSYSDTLYGTTNLQLYIDEINITTGLRSEWYRYTSTNEYSFTLSFTNLTSNNTYIATIYFNHSNWSTLTQTLTFQGYEGTLTTPGTLNSLLNSIIGANSLVWSHFFMFIFLLIIFFYADAEDSGKILIVTGFIFLFINMFLGFDDVMKTAAGGIIPTLLIIFGAVMEWLKRGGTR